MEIRQVEHFLAVVDEGQFTRAAVRCNIAQSGLSASVRALERDLGAPLFYRSTREVVLTDAGRALVPEARRVLTSVAGARDAVEAVTGVVRGRLDLGAVVSAGRWIDLPRLLGEFHHRHPHIELTMRTSGAVELLRMVSEFELDVAFVGLPAVLPDRLEAHPLATARYMFACRAGHPLSDRRDVTVRDVAGAADRRHEEFVDFSRGTVIRSAVDALFAADGLGRTVRLEVPDVDTLLRLVGNGLGVAIVAEPPGPVPPGVALVPLADADVWTLALVTRTTQRTGRAAAAMLALVDALELTVAPER